MYFLRHVVKDAITHVDRVVEPDEPTGRTMFARKIFEKAFAADAGIGIYALRLGRHRFGRAATQYIDERIDVAGREGATIRDSLNASATIAGTNAFIAQVRSSRPLVPNFRPAMKMTFGGLGNRAIASRSRRSAAMHSMP